MVVINENVAVYFDDNIKRTIRMDSKNTSQILLQEITKILTINNHINPDTFMGLVLYVFNHF